MNVAPFPKTNPYCECVRGNYIDGDLETCFLKIRSRLRFPKLREEDGVMGMFSVPRKRGLGGGAHGTHKRTLANSYQLSNFCHSFILRWRFG